MAREVWAALCLVLVIEGLMLLAAPRGWQRMVEQAAQLDPSVLRKAGAVAMVIGLVVLRFVWW